jgi:transposase
MLAYLRAGPGDGVVPHVPELPDVPGDSPGVRAANARLRELLAGRDERIAAQQAEIGLLREQLAALQSQVADLAARVKSNSRNSSRPPSSDGPAKPAPKSLRGKSGRKPGRPKGQPGATMQLSDHPDRVVKHRPRRCGGCGKSLRHGEVTGVEWRQVIDIPPVRAEVTEHQMLTVKCGCGCETRAGAPGNVPAPVRYGPRIMGAGIYLWHGQFLSRDRACRALSEMFGCAPAPGALASAARKTAAFLSPALQAITGHLIAAEVAHFDETGFRTAGRLAWVHSASAGKFALLTVHAKRGKEGMKAAGVARQAGEAAIDPELLSKHEDWYRKAAEAGIALNTARNGKLQQKRHALAARMKDRENDYLRFARDLRVPFSNNAAEQSIRMCKLRIKVSGCMRSMAGAEEFCAIRSYPATADRHGIGALEALTRAFQGNPWIPGTG